MSIYLLLTTIITSLGNRFTKSKRGNSNLIYNPKERGGEGRGEGAHRISAYLDKPKNNNYVRTFLFSYLIM